MRISFLYMNKYLASYSGKREEARMLWGGTYDELLFKEEKFEAENNTKGLEEAYRREGKVKEDLGADEMSLVRFLKIEEIPLR